MEKTKVKINEHVEDFMKLDQVSVALRNASFRLKELVVQTSDSYLKDIAEHLSNEIYKHRKQLNGYVKDNYEFVLEEKTNDNNSF